MMDAMRHTPDSVASCPHLDLGPVDPHGLAHCRECGALVNLRVAGIPVKDFFDNTSTYIVGEGEDVPFNWPGEG